MSLSLQDVINLQRKQSIRYNKLKEDILLKLTEKIAHLAKHGQLRCIYTVPLYTFGHPPYDVSEITSFLEKKLKNEGFCTLSLGKNKLFISWDINDINQFKKKSKEDKKSLVDLKPLLNLK